ncbi:hypothetical protein HanPSC8_Chr14g0626651 [Helianthus annuus]|nr:hypothetical protein HanPSC8_Chr14g0626651 [Helianthus annuus]
MLQIRFAQPSWVLLVLLIFHSVIVLHVLGWLSPRASTIVSQARTTIKLLNNYLIFFYPPVDPFQLLVRFNITFYLKLK